MILDEILCFSITVNYFKIFATRASYTGYYFFFIIFFNLSTMSTKENNSRNRDSTVLDSTSTNTSEKRVRTAEAGEEKIKVALRINNISENDINIQSFKKSLQYTIGILSTLRELIYLTEVIQDLKKKRNNHLYDIHYNEENGCTRVLISFSHSPS